jgi:hypothetical protein
MAAEGFFSFFCRHSREAGPPKVSVARLPPSKVSEHDSQKVSEFLDTVWLHTYPSSDIDVSEEDIQQHLAVPEKDFKEALTEFSEAPQDDVAVVTAKDETGAVVGYAYGEKWRKLLPCPLV